MKKLRDCRYVIAAAVLVALAIVCIAPKALACSGWGRSMTYDEFREHYIEQQLLRLVNEERKQAGVRPLRHDPELSKLSKEWSESRQYVDFWWCEGRCESQYHPGTWHKGEQHDTKWINRDYYNRGENVDYTDKGGDDLRAIAEHIHRNWVTSKKGHYERMLAPGWTHFGVGVAHYWHESSEAWHHSSFVYAATMRFERQY